jgi:protease I
MKEVKIAIIIPSRDFKDETLSELNLLLVKKDIKITVASTTLKDCTGYHGAIVRPDATLKDLDPAHIDALLLVDGPGVESMRLYDHRPLLDLIRVFYENKRLIAGIGNGIKSIARANIIKDKKIANVGKEDENLVRLYRGVPTDNYLVFDKNILTLSNSSKVDELVNYLSDKLESF